MTPLTIDPMQLQLAAFAAAGFFGGCLLAGLVVWLVMRSGARRALNQLESFHDLELSQIDDRRVLAENAAAEWRQLLHDANDEAERLLEQLSDERARLATALEKCNHIPRLEEVVMERDHQLRDARELLSQERARNAELNARMQETLRAAEEKIALLQEAELRMKDAFRALSADALKTNTEQFAAFARQSLEQQQEGARHELEKRQQAINELVKPLSESLGKVDERINSLEKARENAYGALTEQLRMLGESQQRLQMETGNLVKALRAPQVRGRWGEVQLQRVVEMADMLEHCDFVQQESTTTETGRLRPDMLVRLPNRKQIVIDAKVPLDGYMDALEKETEEEKALCLARHAAQVRAHLGLLGQKKYHDQFDPAPEFVVMFLPSESFFSAALMQDPKLLDHGVDNKVLMATPTTLIALLKAVHYGWKQEQMAENAKVISELGQQLYERVRSLTNHFLAMRKGIEMTADSYNKAVGTLERQVLSTTRKFGKLGAAKGEPIAEIEVINNPLRGLQANEFAIAVDEEMVVEEVVDVDAASSHDELLN